MVWVVLALAILLIGGAVGALMWVGTRPTGYFGASSDAEYEIRMFGPF